MLPELWEEESGVLPLTREYSSGDSVMTPEATRDMILKHHLTIDDELKYDGEFLR
jgi:UDP-glucose 4-epimerase